MVLLFPSPIMFQKIATYCLLSTYLAISLFGQTLHALSGCEHAHFHFSHTYSSDAEYAHSGHHNHSSHKHANHTEHDHNHQPEDHSDHADHHKIEFTDGINAVHTHQVIKTHGCALCEYLSQSQTIASNLPVEFSRFASQLYANAPSTIYLAATYTASSPRAPPLA